MYLIDQSLLSFFYANKPIIKTHKCFMTSFKNVICLYRNPLSAISSYYDQLLSQGRVSSSISFSYFFFESPFGLKLYEKFYRSYLNTPRNSKIIFICYEQILLDLYSIVSDLALIFYAEKLPTIVLESLCARHSKQSYYKIQDIYYRYDCRPSFNSSFTSSHVPFVSSERQPSYQKFFSESDYNAYDDWRFKSDVFNSISSRYWAK
ncbi:hypothetical protein SynMEDNS5_00213 [Synechococcus sp. MEDNS5]|uniref:sulfotransferase domain-containing protein n=1 Tax=Synechococcus sp. MEDNS5 TaxID=1442554 RepID=UPI0016471E93|nr:hypothetical protein SynMEDNS5_00213 [Synechococcus sp. MEDNS5]